MDDVIKYDSFLFIPSLWTNQFQLFFADFIKLNLIAIFKGSKVTDDGSDKTVSIPSSATFRSG